jgi:hypothetical protein
MGAAAVAPSRSAPLTAVFATAAALSAFLAVGSLRNVGQSADGLLALALPWMGAGFHATLAWAAWTRPASPGFLHGVAVVVFVHASLAAESLLAGRGCGACLATAGLAVAGGLGLFARKRADGPALALSLGLGALSGTFEPFDRVDGALTRRFWPARVYSIAPTFVDRAELAGCGHGRPVRLLLYEKDCKT